MKRTAPLLILAVALAGAAAAADLRAWAPADSQIVLSVDDMGQMHSLMREAGLEAGLPGLLERFTPPAGRSGPLAELARPESWNGLALLLAVRGVSPVQPPLRPEGILAVYVADAARFETLRQTLVPPDPSKFTIHAVGPYTLYSRPAGAGSPSAPAMTLAVGDQIVLFGFGVDLSRHIAERLAGGSPALPPEADPWLAARTAPPGLRLHLDLAAMGVLSDEAVARAIHAMRDAPAGEAQGAAPRGVRGTLRAMLARMPEEKLNDFAKGLDLDTIRTVDVALCADGERCLFSVAMGMAPGDGVMPAYLDSLRTRQPAVLALLPADTVMVSDFIGDPAGLLHRLQTHAAKTMGPQGEAAFLALELALQIKAGVSLSGQILPLLGGEWGVALLPLSAPAGGTAPVFFCVPADPAPLGPMLQRLGETSSLEVVPAAAPGGTRYTLSSRGETASPVRWHLWQREGVLFLTERPETFDRIGAAGPRLSLAPPAPVAPGQAPPAVLNYTTGLGALPGFLEPLGRLLPGGSGAPAPALPVAGGIGFHQTLLTRSGLVLHTELPWPVLRALLDTMKKARTAAPQPTEN